MCSRIREVVSPVLLVLCVAVATRVVSQENNSPKLFGEGIISGPADDLSPAFTPDGKTVFFTRSNPSSATIMISTLEMGKWTVPTVASFSGTWEDLEPSMAPNGSFLVFASNRPANDHGKVLDGHYSGKDYPGGGGNLWRVDQKGEGWGSPQRLPEAINANSSVFSPSIAADGSIYFMQPDLASGNFHLYRSQYQSGTYLPAQKLVLGDPNSQEVDPAVSPDEKFIVYSSNEPSKHDPKRLKIAFRDKTGWGTPIDLGDEVNEKGSNIEARLGADHKTLFFSTNTVPPVEFPRTPAQTQHDLEQMRVWANGRENIWYVSLAPWLDHPSR